MLIPRNRGCLSVIVTAFFSLFCHLFDFSILSSRRNFSAQHSPLADPASNVGLLETQWVESTNLAVSHSSPIDALRPV